MDDAHVGWFGRIRFVISHYPLELGFGLVVAALAWTILDILGTVPTNTFTPYQAIMIVCVLMILLVVTTTMFSTAKTRVSAVEILEELQKRGNDGGQ